MTQQDAETAVILLQQAAVWYRDGEMVKVEGACREALSLDPGNPDGLSLLAMTLHGRGDSATAIILLRRAVAISPTGRLWSNLGVVLSSSRDHVGGVSAYRQAVKLDPLNVTSWTNLILALDHHPYATPALKLAERRAFDAWHGQPLTVLSPPHENDPDPERRLRVGCVSADFRNHSASMAFGPAIFGRDRERLEVYLYDTNTVPPDQDTLRFVESADHHQYVYDLTDDELARQIRADAIDILVDLSGYSAGNRLLAFARKPAPVQITGWGHATGTGLACMDYLLSDAVMIPPEHEDRYGERILRIPAVMGFDGRPPWPLPADPPARRNGYVTFGHLGRGSKLNERVLAVWSEILRALPTSRLILKANEYSDPSFRAWVTNVLGALGVSSERIDFRGTTTRMLHMAAYNELDIALDPFPHGGGVTALDACLMGVPTVTLLGDYAAGRLTASILQTVGASGGIAQTQASYVCTAIRLAERPWDLSSRLALRRMLLDSIICDERGYAASVEAAYRSAWRNWCEGQRAGRAADLVLAGVTG